MALFGVTCGIYGSMVHTTWAETREETDKLVLEMKIALCRLMAMPFETEEEKQTYYSEVNAFVHRY